SKEQQLKINPEKPQHHPSPYFFSSSVQHHLTTYKVEQNMEVKGATILYTLAGLMITFAGFSALLLGLRQAAGARVSLLDRYLAKTVMTYIFVLTAGALLPALFALYDIQEKWIWRGSGVLFALAMLGYVLVDLQYSAAVYITALTIDFFTVAFGFVTALDVIMQQPMEVSERPAPH